MGTDLPASAGPEFRSPGHKGQIRPANRHRSPDEVEIGLLTHLGATFLEALPGGTSSALS